MRLAKIDATEETELAQRYKISGYPTLRFFRDGKLIDYDGGRTAGDIVSWVKKRSGPPAVNLEDVDVTKALIEKEDIVAIGFFKASAFPFIHIFLLSSVS